VVASSVHTVISPEGIAKGEGSTFYAASLVTGDIYRGNLQTGTGEVLVHAPAGSSAVGLKADDAAHRLFVCGGLTGTARVYNSRTGALVAQYQFAPNGATVAKYGDELALPNGRYDLGLPPPFGPGAPPGTTFNVVVAPAY